MINPLAKEFEFLAFIFDLIFSEKILLSVIFTLFISKRINAFLVMAPISKGFERK